MNVYRFGNLIKPGNVERSLINLDVQIGCKDGYILITVTGDFEKEQIIPALKNIQAECLKVRQCNLIFNMQDLNFKNVRNFDRITFGEKIAELFDYKYKIAAIVKPEDYDGVGELIAINRFVNYKVFHEFDEAIQWLL